MKLWTGRTALKKLIKQFRTVFQCIREVWLYIVFFRPHLKQLHHWTSFVSKYHIIFGEVVTKCGKCQSFDQFGQQQKTTSTNKWIKINEWNHFSHLVTKRIGVWIHMKSGRNVFSSCFRGFSLSLSHTVFHYDVYLFSSI